MTSVPNVFTGLGAAAAYLVILACGLFVTWIVRPAHRGLLLIWGYVLAGIGATGALLLESVTFSPGPTSWTATHPVESGVARFVELAINWLLWPLMWPGWAVFIEPDP
jgi:hypothetical protein